MAYAFSLLEREMKPKYVRVFNIVVDYVGRTGSKRGAIKEAAKIIYNDTSPRAVKRAYRLFVYALCRIRNVEFVEQDVEWDLITDDVSYNMGYYINHHSGPVKDISRFVKDSKANRRLFELKKLVYAVMQDLIKPKYVLTNYVDEVFRDPRIINEVTKLDENIWYNGPRYVKLSKKAAALLYIIVLKIYIRHFGAGNKPANLIKRFFELTGYAPADLTDYLKEYMNVFYDWFLLLA